MNDVKNITHTVESDYLPVVDISFPSNKIYINPILN